MKNYVNTFGAISRKVLIFVIALAFLSSENKTFAQSYSWYRIPNSPYTTARFEDISFINGSTGWLIHPYGVIYRTLDGGYNWTKQDSVGIGSFTDVGFVNESTGWISSRSYNLLKTTNGGFDLVPITNFPQPVPSGLESIHSLSEQFIYGCGRYDAFPIFIKSTDGGISWITKDLSQYVTGLTDCYFFNENSGVVVGRLGDITASETMILFTSDGGQNWVIKYEGNRERESAYKISFPDSQNGYVSTERWNNPDRYVIKTSDGGMNWSELSFPIVNEQGIGFINANTGWIGGNFNPTYGTTDGGMTWFNANIGQFINGFQFFGDTLGYACGQYVYKYERTNNLIQTSSEIPDGFELCQNFPNPFNPSTKINYRLQIAGFTRLVVIDLMGREVAELVNEYHSPGSYEYKFDASNLSSGVYYYKITAGEFVSVKKMLLVK
jgi:photosystem II stability/assembly factor-like uncharacterized protein